MSVTTVPAPPRPASQAELLQRAEQLAGSSLDELAAQAGLRLPQDLRRAKGWVGQLLEWHLGASAGSKPEQDFPELGIELKTLPIDRQGRPLESTFVCVAPLTGITGLDWVHSNVRNKLGCVLWVPVLAERTLPLAERRLGTPFLWIPSAQEEQLLRQDWEELMELIAGGQIEHISAHHGQVLQLRPKAANGRILTTAIGAEGQLIQTRPRGFYLRPRFTAALLASTFGLNC